MIEYFISNNILFQRILSNFVVLNIFFHVSNIVFRDKHSRVKPTSYVSWTIKANITVIFSRDNTHETKYIVQHTA